LAILVIEVLQRSTNGEACMSKKLDVGKALDKLRSSDEPKSRMTRAIDILTQAVNGRIGSQADTCLSVAIVRWRWRAI
jgi:hypothetical protein